MTEYMLSMQEALGSISASRKKQKLEYTDLSIESKIFPLEEKSMRLHICCKYAIRNIDGHISVSL